MSLFSKRKLSSDSGDSNDFSFVKNNEADNVSLNNSSTENTVKNIFSGNSGTESDNSLNQHKSDHRSSSDAEEPTSPVLKRFPTKRRRLLSEDSNDNEYSKKANHFESINPYQLSSSDEEEPIVVKETSTINSFAKTDQPLTVGKYVIPISRRLLTGPKSSTNISKTAYQSASKQIDSLKKKVKRIKSASLQDDDNIDESYQKLEFDSDLSLSDDEDGKSISAKMMEKVLKFFQESSEEELATISRCSTKKASLIIGMRPFKSWKDLLNKFDNTKLLNRDIVWSCIDLLHERQTLCNLMDECSQISKKLEAEFERLQDSKTLSPKKFCHDVVVQQQPKNLTESFILKPYQMIGLNWLALLHRNNVNGILADEMGLGKTIQTISFLAYLQSEGISDGPHLVIVPSSTIDNWIREIRKWCSSLTVILYNGKQDERKSIRRQLMKGYIDCNIILTTYNLAISVPEDRSLFKKLDVYYAIFDEGHMLKNMSSQRFQHLMRINARHRLLLTGTPLQNNLLELMSLLRFVMPHMFKETTSSLIRIFSHSNNDSGSTFAKQRINHAKLIMQPFVLRRLKHDVLNQLPKKLERICKCDLTPSQRNLYEKVKAKFKNKVMKQNLPKSELRNVFVELRKVSNHPTLRREIYSDSKIRTMAKLLKEDVLYAESNETYLFEDMQVMSDFELHNLSLSSNAIKKFKLGDEILLDSGKFCQLDELLPKYKSEEKRVLIFSQFTMMMDILEVYLKLRHYTYLRLDGQTPVSERLSLIDKFNNDPSYFVFILSTKAGGLGINLTSASVVILHDIDTNPYNDKQAEDRCHRLGQLNDVHVIKLIAKNTIEEGMYQCAQYKLQLEKEMTEGDEDAVDMAALINQSLG